MKDINVTARYYAYEAIPENKAIELPNFHFIAQRDHENTMIGTCLDFNLLAFSFEEDDKDALEETFGRICNMVSNHIIYHIDNDILDHLYDNRVPTTGVWEYFSKQNSVIKIAKFKESYIKFLENPNESEVRKLDASRLTGESLILVQELIDMMTKLPPEKFQPQLKEFIKVLTQMYRLETIKIA